MATMERASLKKMLVAVLFPLALRGLRQFFPSEKDATRSIGTQLEFVILFSTLFAACMIVVGPHSNHPLVSLLPEFVKTVVFMTGIYMVIFVLVRRNRSR
ncbi:hypothetical protein [Rhizobium sp. CC-YZS058]|uniref:hypothetical protein n=1 Tax=Rhizobium sp. CC-YZS058 TaxID=3042153 RepID=UPI002B053472|nr:hypothetical protein [Rhizobium sp. CC-YZS058]MEA3533321.1 hypothetical protein [Rhizobium sp. CC-YZS058]